MTEDEFNSKQYWQSRYNAGGNSGAGSAGRLAAFKADLLNQFVISNKIETVIELGTGNGAQLKLYNFPKYLGIDVSEKAITDCRRLYAENASYKFLLDSELSQAYECELSLSIDVIFHLVEDAIFEKYLRDLFFFATRYVIIYSSDFDGTWNAQHVRHRHFTRTVSARFPEWRWIATVPSLYPWDADRQHDTSFANFFIFGQQREPCVFRVPSSTDS